jgi:hypothetical protein
MAERRRQYYTDQKLQAYLIIALILVEVLLLGGMLYLLYIEVTEVIDAHLFRIHLPQEGTWPELFHVLLKVMAMFVVVNVAVMVLMHVAWGRYVRNTLRHFSMVLDKIKSRDFSVLAVSQHKIHPVAQLAELWFEKERARDQRLISLRRRLDEIAQGDLASADKIEVKQIVSEFRRLLQAR